MMHITPLTFHKELQRPVHVKRERTLLDTVTELQPTGISPRGKHKSVAGSGEVGQRKNL